ncbi:hypothetical protein MJ565_25260 [Klebsiella pneumoniae]|nr:hypothetical protein MJ565_25260 [Klebsiella pneumoniae]
MADLRRSDPAIATRQRANFGVRLACEVIQCGIILDREFFTWLEENMDALLALDEAGNGLLYSPLL